MASQSPKTATPKTAAPKTATPKTAAPKIAAPKTPKTGFVGLVDDRCAIARSHWGAPEIDGNVFLSGETRLRPGDRLNVLVEDAGLYDPFARPIGAKTEPTPQPREVAR